MTEDIYAAIRDIVKVLEEIRDAIRGKFSIEVEKTIVDTGKHGKKDVSTKGTSKVLGFIEDMTEKAFRIHFSGMDKPVWIPKSQVINDCLLEPHINQDWIIKDWILKDKGVIE